MKFICANCNLLIEAFDYSKTCPKCKIKLFEVEFDHDAFVEKQASLFKEFEGGVVSAWHLEEMAIGGDYPDWIWSHPSIPLLFLSELAIKINDRWVQIHSQRVEDRNFSFDDYHALIVDEVSTADKKLYESDQPLWVTPESDVRINQFIRMPLGRISNLKVAGADYVPEGLATLKFKVGNHTVFLTTGAVHEHCDGTFTVDRFSDYDFLLQVDGRAPIQANPY